MAPKGISPEDLQKALADPSALAQMLGIDPNAGSADPYTQAKATFAGLPRTYLTSTEAMHETDPSRFGKAPYIPNATGQLLYDNGVIADPASQTVLGFDRLGPNVEGSYAWMLKIQESWSTKEANEWRKKLSNQGYDVATKGGMAQDLLAALQEYHTFAYLNFGKPLPKTPKGAVGQAVRSTFDRQALKETAKTWGQVPFEEDLDSDTAEYFADRTIDLAVELAKEHKNWSMEQIQAGAELRAQKEFIRTPGVRGAIRDAEEDEMDDSLRQNIVSIAQLGSVR